jgi:hypothetical protein
LGLEELPECIFNVFPTKASTEGKKEKPCDDVDGERINAIATITINCIELRELIVNTSLL